MYATRGATFLPNTLQEQLLTSSTIEPFRALHYAGWIRMEFKKRDAHWGQIRVYMLPDDVARGTIDRHQRSLRKAMQDLIGQLDIAHATWTGNWSEGAEIVHIDSFLNQKSKNEPSLFYLFNTLPSPSPKPENMKDQYVKNAMEKIMDNNVEGLMTEMYQYQRRSAALMLQREAQPDQIIDPRLRHLVDQRGETWYCDVDSGSCFREPRTYEAAKGGICAETMGLGKTLICLALILATKELSSQIPVEHSIGTIPVRQRVGSLLDMAASTIGRHGIPWKSEFARVEAEGGYDFSNCREALLRGAGYYYLHDPMPRRQSRNPIARPPRKIWLTAVTIVIVPNNLVQQWRAEIQKHTTGLKVLYMNYTKTKLPPAEQLAQYDILVFGKQRFDKEAKDGIDTRGRRATKAKAPCNCPYIGSSRERDCICFNEDEAHRSPLKDLHFKRIIVDEGHTLGNSSKSSKTEAITVLDLLQTTSRWIVSGTPTRGLYGMEVAVGQPETEFSSSSPQRNNLADEAQASLGGFADLPAQSTDSFSDVSEQDLLFYKQERKDLEKLGNIATMYLKARPWSISPDENDAASWNQLVMQPRHGSNSRGNMDCLRATLEGMIIRHRPDDVLLDVTLPPLHQNAIYLDGSMQNKLSLNTFSMMVITNAITSERKDADYFFHPRQRKNLLQLVSNLRQASFFWSGFEAEHVRNTIGNARRFLDERKVPVTPEDEVLLVQAIECGEAVLSNDINQAISKWHEMPMHIENEWSEDTRKAWALDGKTGNPTLIGATMVHAAQKFVDSQLGKGDCSKGLADAGHASMRAALEAHHSEPISHPPKRHGGNAKFFKRAAEAPPTLAGGVTVGDGSSPRKKTRITSVTTMIIEQISTPETPAQAGHGIENAFSLQEETEEKGKEASAFAEVDAIHSLPQIVSGPLISSPSLRSGTMRQPPLVSSKAAKHEERFPKHAQTSGRLDPSSTLASTAIVSTASTKLSYLMDAIMAHQSEEKIIVFYEADNIAYYIAQALECLGVRHLIYAKSLSSERRAQYVVTFNQSNVFRVLLMDVSQAAYGLDLSSASRVYFVNPVFSPQVEVQAVKRAHRIGQTKPVFVETLVLRGSIEEVILERRGNMSNEEHNNCKSILDDQTLYDWIRNVRFLSLPESHLPQEEQMARLESKRLVWGITERIGHLWDPDTDLVTFDDASDVEVSTDGNRESSGLGGNGKGKRKAN